MRLRWQLVREEISLLPPEFGHDVGLVLLLLRPFRVALLNVGVLWHGLCSAGEHGDRAVSARPALLLLFSFSVELR